MVSIPHLLTASRVAAALALFGAEGPIRLPLLLWGAISDYLDGVAARRFKTVSPFGAGFDLAADGVFFLASFGSAWMIGQLPGIWLLLILLGTVPEILAQAVIARRHIRRVGSPHRIWNRFLGGYSYACVVGLTLGFNPAVLAAVQVAAELWANVMDLRLALRMPADHAEPGPAEAES
jgi:phosphatidylglycerophosphate synthase